MKKILTLTLLGCCLVPAHAEYKDGNQLHSQMQEKYASMDWFNAIGYVTGVADTLTGITVCGPNGGSGIPAQQVYDIVKQYLQDHPGTRHLSADRLVGRALERVFPCRKGNAL